jgi:exonuclease-1
MLFVPHRFVVYFMSRIQLLRTNGLEPIVVFDGGRLPIKGDEEESRHRCPLLASVVLAQQ